jgi:hypothetical protein
MYCDLAAQHFAADEPPDLARHYAKFSYTDRFVEITLQPTAPAAPSILYKLIFRLYSFARLQNSRTKAKRYTSSIKRMLLPWLKSENV